MKEREKPVSSDKEENIQSQESIQSLANGYLLFGLNYYDLNGKLIKSEQYHGRVLTVDPVMGIEVQLSGETNIEKHFLPPIMDLYKRAKKGTYTLSNGEKVVNPDWLGIICYQVQTLDINQPFPEQKNSK